MCLFFDHSLRATDMTERKNPTYVQLKHCQSQIPLLTIKHVQQNIQTEKL